MTEPPQAGDRLRGLFRACPSGRRVTGSAVAVGCQSPLGDVPLFLHRRRREAEHHVADEGVGSFWQRSVTVKHAEISSERSVEASDLALRDSVTAFLNARY
jgi:hypothetical protein